MSSHEIKAGSLWMFLPVIFGDDFAGGASTVCWFLFVHAQLLYKHLIFFEECVILLFVLCYLCFEQLDSFVVFGEFGEDHLEFFHQGFVFGLESFCQFEGFQVFDRVEVLSLFHKFLFELLGHLVDSFLVIVHHLFNFCLLSLYQCFILLYFLPVQQPLSWSFLMQLLYLIILMLYLLVFLWKFAILMLEFSHSFVDFSPSFFMGISGAVRRWIKPNPFEFVLAVHSQQTICILGFHQLAFQVGTLMTQAIDVGIGRF